MCIMLRPWQGSWWKIQPFHSSHTSVSRKIQSFHFMIHDINKSNLIEARHYLSCSILVFYITKGQNNYHVPTTSHFSISECEQ